MDTLGDALPREQARVRELIGIYRSIGPSGAFAVAGMEADLREADAAVMEQDLPRMIRVYESLKGWKE